MNRKTSKKVEKAFKLLMKPGTNLTVQDAALNAGCSRSAIYRSKMFATYQAWLKAEAEK